MAWVAAELVCVEHGHVDMDVGGRPELARLDEIRRHGSGIGRGIGLVELLEGAQCIRAGAPEDIRLCLGRLGLDAGRSSCALPPVIALILTLGSSVCAVSVTACTACWLFEV